MNDESKMISMKEDGLTSLYTNYIYLHIFYQLLEQFATVASALIETVLFLICTVREIN